MRKIITTAAVIAAGLIVPSVAHADPAICHNGVLSDDAGQGCADGLYERTYGSGGATRSAAPTQSYSVGGSSNLSAIAQCESGNNPAAVSPSGTYTGLFQFDDQTWQSVGGTGRAGNASASEQWMRATRLYAQRGSAPWPSCG